MSRSCKSIDRNIIERCDEDDKNVELTVDADSVCFRHSEGQKRPHKFFQRSLKIQENFSA